MKLRALLSSCLLSTTAIQAATFTVNIATDELHTPSGSTRSLREALRDAAATPGDDLIVFAPALSGATLVLGGELDFNDTSGRVAIDASSLRDGLVLDAGPASNRALTVQAGRRLTVAGLAFRGGGGTGGAVVGAGGAVDNLGSLALVNCSFTSNTATGAGGAIRNAATGSLDARGCAFSGNEAGFGGAVANFGTASFVNCTFFGNSATSAGGALDNNPGRPLSLTHCTVSGNRAPEGGAIANLGTLSLANSIVGGNQLTAPGTGPDILNEEGATVAHAGVNLVQTPVAGSGSVGGTGSVTLAHPRLAPFTHHGGPTATCALLPGSPALDAALDLAPAVAIDQRGLPRGREGNGAGAARPDIGAYEAQVVPVSLGFNFSGEAPRNLLPGEWAGAPAFAQSRWNNLRTADAGSRNGSAPNADGRSDSNGTTHPGLLLGWEAPNTWTLDDAPPTTANAKLMAGYLDANAAGDGRAATNLFTRSAQPFFAVSGLPPAITRGGYRVVVYSDGDTTEGRVGEYWLTSNRRADPGNVSGEEEISPHFFLRDSANFTGTWVRLPDTATSLAEAADANHLVFGHRTEPGFILRTEERAFRATISAVQAVRNEVLVVTTALDENDPPGTLGTGISLREALRDAPDGGGVVFDPDVFTGDVDTIALGSEIHLARSVTLDAGGLSVRLRLNAGPGSSRHFTVAQGRSVQLLDLTLVNGDGTGGNVVGAGGAIDNAGTLTAVRCTFSGNRATGAGGAIRNAAAGHLSLIQSTLNGNSASFGGAVANFGLFTARHCTFNGNTATNGGGALDNNPAAIARLTHVTLANNTAANGGGFDNLGQLTLAYSIIGPNSIQAGGSGRDGLNETQATLTLAGTSLIGTALAGSGSTAGTGTLQIAAPRLAPLADNGGATRTRALQPASPARNAAVGSPAVADQRGFPILNLPDLGAHESQVDAPAAAATLEDIALDVPFTAGQAGAFTATFEPPGLVQDATITSHPPLPTGENRRLRITPAKDQSGTVTVTLLDPDSGSQTRFQLHVTAVNDAPSFTPGPDPSVPENSGPQRIPGWASDLHRGPADESTQTLAFLVSNDHPTLFSTPPALAADGTLTFTPAPNAHGSATLTVRLRDDGGSANGGIDTSAPKTVTLTVTPAAGPVQFSGPGISANGTLLLPFTAHAGRTYRLEQADSLDGPWADTGLAPIAGDGSTRGFVVGPARAPSRFFRLVSDL